MKKEPFIAITDADMKMVFDPYRLRIIYTVSRSKDPLTVKEIASKLNEPANKVHYHVMKLFNFGYFKLVKTKNINGIIAKYYTNVYTGPFFGKPSLDSNEFPVHIRNLTSILDEISMAFKNDIVAYSNLKNDEGKHPGGQIQLDRIKLYMTRDEANEVVQKVAGILGKYMAIDETKEVYTTIQTIARIK